jgi:hypothetical protein
VAWSSGNESLIETSLLSRINMLCGDNLLSRVTGTNTHVGTLVHGSTKDSVGNFLHMFSF